MSYVREDIDARVREFFEEKFYSSFIQRNPLLYMMGLKSIEGRGKFGQPGAASVWGGADLGSAQIDSMLGSKSRFIRYQMTEPDDGDFVDYRGDTPAATGFAEDNVGMTEFRYSKLQEPLKVSSDAMDMAKGDAGIGQIVEETAGFTWNRFLKRTELQLWYGGTGTAGKSKQDLNSTAEQNRAIWRESLGLVYTVGTQDNLYGRVDRSVETTLNPFQINAATQLPSTVVSLDLTRDINIGTTLSDGTDFTGRADINPNGMGCDVFIVPPALFRALQTDADSRGIQTLGTGIPNHFMGGYRYPIIQWDNVYIVHDYNCPSGTMYCLSLDQFLLETRPGQNFEWTGFTQKDKSEEGGAEYEWGRYRASIRLSTRLVNLMGTITNLTTGS